MTGLELDNLSDALTRCEADFDAKAFEVIRHFADQTRENHGMLDSSISQEIVNRCVWALLLRGQVEDAFACAYQNHAQCDARNASADIRALTARTLGALYTELGDGVHALETLVAALKVATESHIVLRQVQIWNSLGLLFCMYGDLVEARACFMRATTFFDDPNLRRTEQLPVWMNLTVLSFRTQAFDEGLQFADKCAALPDQSKTVLGKWRMTRALVARSRLLLALERTPEAHAAFKDLQELTDGLDATDPLMGDVLQVEGLLAIFDGYADRGAEKLAQALHLSNYSSRVREELIDVCVWAFEKSNRWDLAASFLKKAVDEKARGSHVAFALRIASISDWRDFSNRSDETSRVVLGGERSAQEKLHRLKEILLEQEYLERLSVTTELRDDATGGHCYRVGRVAARLGRQIGLDKTTCDTLEVAGRLHDIGKVGIPDAILLKPGPLTEEERAIMQRHCHLGAQLLKSSKVPTIQMALSVALCHHEKWDGSGYPEGLAGEEIPIVARLTAVADVFDALINVRPYKHAWEVEEAVAEIERGAGTHFDPALVPVFVELVNSGEIARITAGASMPANQSGQWLTDAKLSIWRFAEAS